jgi:hypothetical protein
MTRCELLCLILAFSVAACAMPVDVNIPETIKGVSQYISYERIVDAKPQQFLMDWENQGSVSCRARMRMDVLMEDNLVYTGWSEEKAIEPGDHSEFQLYFYPNITGNYTATIFAYYCNTIEELKNASFSAYVPGSEDKETREASNASAPAPFEIKTSNTNGSVEFRIRSKTTLSELLIVPAKYPLGWIAEPKKTGEITAGEEMTVDVPYVPSVWKPAQIAYDVSTLDGRYHETVSVTLSEQKKGYSLEQLSIGLLLIAVLFLTTLLIREKRRDK